MKRKITKTIKIFLLTIIAVELKAAGSSTDFTPDSRLREIGEQKSRAQSRMQELVKEMQGLTVLLVDLDEEERVIRDRNEGRLRGLLNLAVHTSTAAQIEGSVPIAADLEPQVIPESALPVVPAVPATRESTPESPTPSSGSSAQSSAGQGIKNAIISAIKETLNSKLKDKSLSGLNVDEELRIFDMQFDKLCKQFNDEKRTIMEMIDRSENFRRLMIGSTYAGGQCLRGKLLYVFKGDEDMKSKIKAVKSAEVSEQPSEAPKTVTEPTTSVTTESTAPSSGSSAQSLTGQEIEDVIVNAIKEIGSVLKKNTELKEAIFRECNFNLDIGVELSLIQDQFSRLSERFGGVKEVVKRLIRKGERFRILVAASCYCGEGALRDVLLKMFEGDPDTIKEIQGIEEIIIGGSGSPDKTKDVTEPTTSVTTESTASSAGPSAQSLTAEEIKNKIVQEIERMVRILRLYPNHREMHLGKLNLHVSQELVEFESQFDQLLGKHNNNPKQALKEMIYESQRFRNLMKINLTFRKGEHDYIPDILLDLFKGDQPTIDFIEEVLWGQISEQPSKEVEERVTEPTRPVEGARSDPAKTIQSAPEPSQASEVPLPSSKFYNDWKNLILLRMMPEGSTLNKEYDEQARRMGTDNPEDIFRGMLESDGLNRLKELLFDGTLIDNPDIPSEKIAKGIHYSGKLIKRFPNLEGVIEELNIDRSVKQFACLVRMKKESEFGEAYKPIVNFFSHPVLPPEGVQIVYSCVDPQHGIPIRLSCLGHKELVMEFAKEHFNRIAKFLPDNQIERLKSIRDGKYDPRVFVLH